MLGTTCYTQSNLFTNMGDLETWSLSIHLFSSILQSHKRIIPIRQFMPTESKHVINNNNNDNKQILLGWNHWMPPTLLPNMARGGQKDRRKGDPDVVSAGLSAAQQARWNGHLSSGARGSCWSPQRDSEVKWVTVFEVCPAVIGSNIQQMCGSSAC